MAKSSGLGRGLDALIPRSGRAGSRASIERIRRNPFQPRDHSTTRARGPCRVISTHGILQPVIVRETADGDYELIAGERRLRAAARRG